MRLIVRNISNSHLPIKGTGVVIGPGTYSDLCDALGLTPEAVKERPDISRWIQTRRLQVVEDDSDQRKSVEMQSIAPVEKETVLAEAAESGGYVPSEFILEQPDDEFKGISNRKLKAMCVELGLEPPRSRAKLVELLKAHKKADVGE